MSNNKIKMFNFKLLQKLIEIQGNIDKKKENIKETEKIDNIKQDDRVKIIKLLIW